MRLGSHAHPAAYFGVDHVVLLFNVFYDYPRHLLSLVLQIGVDMAEVLYHIVRRDG